MAEDALLESDRSLRRRRGPPPRLYVIARLSPVPWIQLRRLGPEHRARLARHYALMPGHLAQDSMDIAEFCTALDFANTVCFGAFAGNEIVAAAIGLDPRPGGLGIAITVVPEWRKHGLRRLLVGQVAGVTLPAQVRPTRLLTTIAGAVTRLGGRVIPVDGSAIIAGAPLEESLLAG